MKKFVRNGGKEPCFLILRTRYEGLLALGGVRLTRKDTPPGTNRSGRFSGHRTGLEILEKIKIFPPLPGYRPAISWVHYTTSCNTQSSAPEDGQNYRPKLLLLHLVGCLYYLYLNIYTHYI